MSEDQPKSDTDSANWQELAEQLHEKGGVPQRRAEVVALIETEYSHSETADVLGLEHRANVAQHVKEYREQDRPEAEWLAEHGPEI